MSLTPSLCSFPLSIAIPTLPVPIARWKKDTDYALDDEVLSDPDADSLPTKIYKCVAAGHSAAAPPGPAGTGSGIVDGTGSLRWDYVGPFVVPALPTIPALVLPLPPCVLDEF